MCVMGWAKRGYDLIREWDGVCVYGVQAGGGGG